MQANSRLRFLDEFFQELFLPMVEFNGRLNDETHNQIAVPRFVMKMGHSFTLYSHFITPLRPGRHGCTHGTIQGRYFNSRTQCRLGKGYGYLAYEVVAAAAKEAVSLNGYDDI